MSEDTPTKPRVPVVDGWFTMTEEPALLATRCKECATVFFPKEESMCRNPACRSTSFREVELSRRGTLWSYTTAHYQPPAPYVSDGDFEPYSIAAVELADEKMTVLGQVVPEVDPKDLEVGMEMELTLGRLYADEENEYVVWKWRPVGGAR